MTNPLRPSPAEAAAAWAALVDADAEQVARVREPEPPRDHYSTTAARFRAGVRPTPELPALLAIAEPGQTWLDIGAGGGRLTVPLAAHVARLIAVEPSEAMRGALTGAANEAGVRNLEVRDCRWPDPTWDVEVDVALAAHSFYDIRDIVPFIEAMERVARHRCVALLRPQARGAAMAPLFEAVHGEPVHLLPSLHEFVALLGARGAAYEVRLAPAEPDHDITPRDDAFAEARRLLWLAEGSEKEQRMRALMEEWWGAPEGIRMPRPVPRIGVVSWTPMPAER